MVQIQENGLTNQNINLLVSAKSIIALSLEISNRKETSQYSSLYSISFDKPVTVKHES